MPIDLSAMRGNRRDVTVKWLGETIKVTYRPLEITPEYQDRVFKAIGSGELEGSQWADILSVVEKWDITDGAVPVPLTAEGMDRVPTPILQAINMAIQEDVSPNRKSAATSGAGSLKRG